MHEEHEAELRLALAQGVLSGDEANALREEAIRLGRSPLELAKERGLVPASARERIHDALRRTPAPDDGSTIAPPPPASALSELPDSHPPERPESARSAPRAATPPPSPAPADEPPFPVPGWDLYRPLGFLGQGGMGQVFLAFDTRLQREVALKFVKGNDQELTRRMLLEARSQARVNHERVCKVYEAGEVAGLTYIAMQFVAGVPLDRLGPTLSVEQKAVVIREVAQGIHEAHRVGLIHRDLKPANIMVEQSDQGSLRPFVMDFGLAHQRSDGTAATGEVAGTVQYMSPEQARGEVNNLDRRADVYSLGATLYQLLAGVPPISGGGRQDVLRRIPTEEPRALDRNVPEDMAAIALRCLEKDRSARYDSARALAEDLDRFLAGEPIQARAGRWYRVRRRLRKHRALVSVGAAGLLAVSIATGMLVASWREAALREELARSFTEQVEQIEAQARYSGLAPRHDVTEDREALRKRMAELESKIGAGGERAVGPGQYALGRGYLALDDNARALAALRSAWEHGYREPRAAYALALALGHEYREKLSAAERLLEPERRKARRAEVQEQYQRQVLDFLRLSEGADVPSTDYVNALLAFYEQRHDEALKHLGAVGKKLPWFYEALQLRGDILQARAYERWQQGDQKGRRADLLAGRQAYEAAAEIARSVPAVYRGLARLETSALMIELFGKGDVHPHYERGLKALELDLEIAPDDIKGRVLRAELHRHLADFALTSDGKVEQPLEEALKAAADAQARAPGLAEARIELAAAHWMRGHWLDEHYKDPTEDLRLAVEQLNGVDAANRNLDFYMNLGLILTTWADAEERMGKPSAAHRNSAIETYRSAIRQDERFLRAWSGLAIAYFQRASAPGAADPDGDLAEAQATLQRVRGLNPEYVVAYYYGGEVEVALARRAEGRGEDPRPILKRALEQYQKGLTINPKFFPCLNGLGGVESKLGQAEWDRGGDPFAPLERAQPVFERILELAPNQPQALTNLVEALGRMVRFRARRGEDPAAVLPQALERYRQAIQAYEGSPVPRASRGLTLVALARFALKRGQDPSQQLAAAVALAKEALAKRADYDQALRVLANARSLAAQWEARQGRPTPASFEEAANLYMTAMEKAPDRQDQRLEFVDFCLEWNEVAPGTVPEPVVAQAQRRVDELLRRWPEWPEARALGAGLLAMRAERAAPGERPALRRQALKLLAKALDTNPNLAWSWQRRRAALELP